MNQPNRKRLFSRAARTLTGTMTMARAALVLLVMLLTATTAWAQEVVGTEGVWNYTYDSGTNILTIVSYNGTDASVTTPTMLGGHAVTAIGDQCFMNNTQGSRENLTSVTISEGITTIGHNAFTECRNLASVSLPNSLVSIAMSAFADCSALTSITIPGSVTSIGALSFQHSGLTDLYYAGTKAQWNSVTLGAAIFSGISPEPTVHWQCTATFYMQGHGTAPAAQTVYSAVANALTMPTAPTATGYDFGGWYRNAACTQAFDFTAALDDDVTVYAKWTALENTITFDLDGRGSAISNQTVLSGGTVTEPAVQFDDTDGIEGWYTDAGRTTPYDFTTAVDHSMTLYAKWAAAGTATITTNGEGGTATLTNAKGQTFNDGKVMPGEYTLTVTPESGYSFSGTYTLTNRTSHISDMNNDIVGSATKTYVLDLTEKDAVVIVTFGTNPVLSIMATTDGTATAGTWTLVDGRGNEYDNGSTVTVPSGGVPTSADNITLTVTMGETVGCAMTIVNNGTKKQVTSDVTSYGFTPAGSVDIELFFYDKTDGMMTLLNDDGAQPDGDKNADRLSAASGQKRMVTLSGRTLYRDGDWNTLCLPFDFDIEGSALDKTGVTLMELDTETAYSGHKTGYDEGTLYLNFKSAGTTIEAGKPYIIKWTKPSKYDQNPGNYDIANPVFGGVTVSNDTPTAVASEDGSVSLVGTYGAVSYDSETRSVLFLGTSNTLYFPDGLATTNINTCRAYFLLSGITAGDAAALARSFVLNFGEDEATGMREITDPTPAWEGSGCAWYSIDGRRLSGKPTKSGIYINNGKKIIIK